MPNDRHQLNPKAWDYRPISIDELYANTYNPYTPPTSTIPHRRIPNAATSYLYFPPPFHYPLVSESKMAEYDATSQKIWIKYSNPTAVPCFTPGIVSSSAASSQESDFNITLSENFDPKLDTEAIDITLRDLRFDTINPQPDTPKPWREELERIFNSLPSLAYQREYIKAYSLGYNGEPCPTLPKVFEQAHAFGVIEKAWDVDVEGAVYRKEKGISDEGEIKGIKKFSQC
ncbi:hypothetical protein ABW19_dt0203031 [Dactylella cylindrospora]|nr:hypothetical protein ABW19_dt0203031 [Dactylella cylindrospora]